MPGQTAFAAMGAEQEQEPDESTPVPRGQGAGASPFWQVLLVLGLLSGTLFAIRILAPPNLLDHDQERPAAYVLDAVQNGQWICQRDWLGDITSKPPMWTWLSALLTLAWGRINEVTLYLPGALGAFGGACLVYLWGRRAFGFRAAFLGALAAILTTAAARQFGLARTDGVFAFTVALTAFLAYRSWTTGSGWTWFWVAGAVATLTKGPLGLVFGGLGLLAAVWEKRSGNPLPLRGRQWPGVLLYLALAGGWLLLAYAQWGDAVFQKLLGKELAGHAVSGGGGSFPGAQFYKQPLYYLGRAAPWSLLAYLGLWRIWARPAVSVEARRLERFLFCWLAGGIAVLSLAPHQRADLLWPLMPAGALIAGIELDRLTATMRPGRMWAALWVAVLAGICGLAVFYCVIHARLPLVRQTVAVKELADRIRLGPGSEFPLTHVDDPMAFQVYLNTLRKPVTAARAAALLRGEAAAFVAVNEMTAADLLTNAVPTRVFHLARTPDLFRKKSVHLLANRATLDAAGPFAVCFDPWFLRGRSVKILSATEGIIALEFLERDGEAILVNESSGARVAEIRLVYGGLEKRERRRFAAGEEWRVKAPSE